jgi:hypothetical protein
MHARRRLLVPSALSSAALFTLLVLALPLDARADSGDGVGFGPVLGITTNGSLSLGWELSGSYRLPLVRLALGGSYQLEREGDDPRYFHYAAWEPWVYVGGTLGAALTDGGEGRVVYGLWEAYAQDLGDPLFDANYNYLDDDEGPHWILSLSIGWRGIGGTQQFYFTPKIWRFQGWDFFS